jgi:hypothetical protein
VSSRARAGRFASEMGCRHDGFWNFQSHYDRRVGELVYFWTCESCRSKLAEAHREAYRPSFDPHGNDRFLALPAEQS